MRLETEQARARLVNHDHGVLSTLHPGRGVDTVPVVYALDDDGHLGIPIDTVKPKISVELQREKNLAVDPRATLLVDQWDPEDWSRLWWVRTRLVRVNDESRGEELADLLAAKYSQYVDKPFATVMVFRITAITGWSAS